MLTLSLLPLCCWLPQVTVLLTPTVLLKLNLPISQQPLGERLRLCLPFLAKPPLRTEQLLCTDGKTAFPPVTLLYIDFFIFSAGLQEKASHQWEPVLKEGGWFIIQRALQTQPYFSVA